MVYDTRGTLMYSHFKKRYCTTYRLLFYSIIPVFYCKSYYQYNGIMKRKRNRERQFWKRRGPDSQRCRPHLCRSVVFRGQQSGRSRDPARGGFFYGVYIDFLLKSQLVSLRREVVLRILPFSGLPHMDGTEFSSRPLHQRPPRNVI